MIHIWISALTLIGATLFFASGLLAAQSNRAQRELADPGAPALAGAGPIGGGGGLGSDAVDLETEVASSALLDRVLFAEADSRSTRLELEAQVARLTELERERDALAAQLARHADEPAPPPAHAGADVHGALERERLRTLELQRALTELRARLAQAPDAEVVAGLRHDLTVAAEQTRARLATSERQAAENAQQKMLLADLPLLRDECARLRAENAGLRTRDLIAGAPVRPRKAVHLDDANPKSWGKALQALVDELAGGAQIRAVVVADELGLVVAASGENGDELAAAGVVIVHAGARVGQLLPVGKLRKLIMQDEHDLTVTVRPLDDENGNLSLVTLGLGDSQEVMPAGLINDNVS
jgi:hypothetical protein